MAIEPSSSQSAQKQDKNSQAAQKQDVKEGGSSLISSISIVWLSRN